MNDDIKWLNEIRIKKTIKALNDNGMEACLVSDKESLINKIDEKNLNTMNDLREYIYTKKPGDIIQLEISRGKINKAIKITLR